MEEYMNYQQIRVEQMKEKECLENRTIWINEGITEITEFVVLKMFDKIVEQDKKQGIKPEDADIIHLKVSSYGGNVDSSLSIISKIESLKSIGYKIYSYGYGKCMSGAFKIFISASKRFAQPTCDLMCHMPNHGEWGGYYTMEDERRKYEGLKRSWERCKKVILKYTNIPEEILDDSAKRNDDLYFWADESIEQNLGIVDELI